MIRRQDGFTLLEVLAAVVLLGTTVTILLSAVSQGQVAQAHALESNRALWLCQRKLSEVAIGIETGSMGRFDPPWGAFSWQANTKRLDNPGLTRIVVTVSWQGSGGVRVVTLSTLSGGGQW